MKFPIHLNLSVPSANGNIDRTVNLNSPLTVLVGPNGSGKTHLMRSLKLELKSHTSGKYVRFLSAGRMGLMEQYRSDFDGQRGASPNYENASYGGKRDSQLRMNFETLNGDFHTLAARPDILIKVSERLRKLFKRDISIFWDSGQLKVEFQHEEYDHSYSSAREASGLIHLVGLLAALYDDAVGALLIDEPEVSLHPQLQAFLLREIKHVSGIPENGNFKKLIIISTHSTEFIDLNTTLDIPNFIFCQELGEEPRQISPKEPTLKNQKLQELVIRMGQEHKLALFSKSPLLVEGPSDTIICGGLANKLDLHIEAGGSQILPVIGKGEFPTVVKLLRLMGKTPIVLADADAFVDTPDLSNTFLAAPEADSYVNSNLGSPSAVKFCNAIRSDFLSLVDTSWDQISILAETTLYWKTRKDKDSGRLAKQRSAFSALFLNDKLPEGWSSIKERLTIALDLLERFGCFILRRGSIEEYYLKDHDALAIGKPLAAVNEVNCFDNLPNVSDNYSDVVRCIHAASQAPAINEAELVRDYLLSIASVALEHFKTEKDARKIQSQVKRILGDKADLFKMSVKDNHLIIDLESSVLEIDAFPIYMEEGENINDFIPKALGLPS
ncbi:ATP-dependent nuclease [Tritonibacter mobilis]|uniref:AAA+ ATPase domain-containing protein n=1 Tax=Tritonibacter mobilis F1926 TaxID=1265309 RepID=A0A1B1A0V4_9RHOB|nr:AAA family ATPase [Tritonibacter mobilis]ANP40220.1 hypothetical protein K529_005515 [Tritonibacter mobilis F1926]KJZ25408.1 hypothetical protein TW79_07090 [Tritonibacter mobilis]